MENNGKFPDASTSPQSSSKNKEPRLCLICGGKSHGLHFGAESCRACTAFFRRSVVRNMIYTCPGRKYCARTAMNRRMCQACRFKKCTEAGMVKTAVQGYEGDSDLNVDSRACPSVNHNGEENIDHKIPILTKMAKRYKELNNTRENLHGMTNVIPKIVNVFEADAIYLKEAGLVADFMSESFEEINFLKEDQRKLMLKMFLRQFLVLEGEYQASLKEMTSAMILPNGDMIDFDQLEIFFPSTTGSEIVSQEDVLKFHSPVFDLYKRCILEPMNQLKIDEMEFLFVCGTVFWDNCCELQSEKCETLAKKMRSRLADEIVFYFKKKKDFMEPAVRISSLMTIITGLQRVVFKLQQDIEMNNVFNVYKMDEIFYNIVNCNF